MLKDAGMFRYYCMMNGLKEQVANIPPQLLLRILNKVKNMLKNDNTYNDMCKEYNVLPNTIDFIPMKFDNLPTSARTQNGIITFNYKLLQGKLIDICHYAIHECGHFYQQCYGKDATPGSNEGDYLKNPSESDSFKYQLQFLDDHFGLSEANNYVEHLLDHHDKSGKEREKLKDTLMEKVDD